jgi:release factor glutamine methyltransferase
MDIEFASFPFTIAPGRVMAPRPATEALADAAVARVGNCPARVADVGTGSGAIAVSIALRAPAAEVWASDLSECAVRIARRNALRHGVADRVHVVQGDLLDPLPGSLDVIAANLPYLPDRLRGTAGYLEYEAEPELAIWAPGDGLAHYRRLLAGAEQLLAPSGALIVQLHREVLQAERWELHRLRNEIERYSLLAA